MTLNMMQICRYAFGIGVAIVFVLNILTIFNYSFGQNGIIWMITAMFGCICGGIGAWKEHFLMIMLCSVSWAILLALTYFKHIYAGYYYSEYGYHVEIGMAAGGGIYGAVLYSNGKRDTGLPHF